MLEMRGEIGIATSGARARGAENVRPHRRMVRLEGVVRKEILPRLLQVHARSRVALSSPAAPFEILARALIDDDGSAAGDAFARLSVATSDDVWLLNEVLAPAARRLQDWWQQDACDFLSVSQGVARLRAFLAALAAPVGDEALAPVMLMLTPPDETHRFGAEMAADLFRREGWRVERADGDLRLLRKQAFDAIAVSCGCDRAAATLPSFIAKIKARTGSSRVPILLGGALFLDHPARAQNLGADFVASDLNSFRRLSRALIKPRHV